MSADLTTAPSGDVADRLLQSFLAATDLLAVYVGDRLGLYRSLIDHGPATAGELAERTGTHTRYIREWLEQQAVAGLLIASSDGDHATRVFSIPDGMAEVTTDHTSVDYVGVLGRFLGAIGTSLPGLLEAYRSGGGVSWAEMGEDARLAQAEMNRPWFEHQLAEALAGVEPLHERLSRPGVRIADVGCGVGWSAIALARAYPSATVVGFDIDEPSIEMARANLTDSDVADRVNFTAGDAAHMPEGEFDVAFAFECVHDMPHPVDVLAATRRALKPGGVMVVMDEHVRDTFSTETEDADRERLFYGYSLFICLPDGMSTPGSAGTGTVMRRSTMERYAAEAGFSSFADLPIQDFGFFRFYEMEA